MQKYLYINEISTFVTLKVKDADEKLIDRDLCFHNGEEYNLPEENDFVKLLVAQNTLQPIKQLSKPEKI